ncbi:MAG TPA: hypothetical protein DDZ42_21935 [Candidatus Rokubacteria bacterium]|nr:hypothetical protein [Candidatus Rokubacteria bacterium]
MLMRSIFRLLVVVIVALATYYVVYWVPVSLVSSLGGGWLPGVVALLCAAGVGWYVWRRLGSMPAGLLASMSSGAIVVGAIGFCAGFVGPILLTPEANQGPLLGIFVTGPLGFVLGGLGGLVYWLARGRRAYRE